MRTFRAVVVGCVVYTTLAACSADPTGEAGGVGTIGSGNTSASYKGGYTYGSGNHTGSIRATDSGGMVYGSGNRTEESGARTIGSGDSRDGVGGFGSGNRVSRPAAGATAPVDGVKRRVLAG